jgi:hypothetical protein
MNVADSARETLVRLPSQPDFCQNFTGRELAGSWMGR